ncbi:MAG: quinoprotein relay system zinc metallohydrolase 2 [Candidatus Thiodiazotropha sp. (ex Ctena orbiculata)]|nr:quinoprotein relay system zinc metallohydrolase 2 [Candidatus Thiodiazotropha taylori]MBT3034117.1 quinoprotein relay system zinc metallohydrolase 2 [Candidatus Thiodiazotropha taylori]
MNRQDIPGMRLLLLSMVLLQLPPGVAAWRFTAEEIAPGIYLRPGMQEEFSPRNYGHIANIGFIVGNEAVAVIDTGSTLKEGLSLRRAIREITDLPIAYVILTHMHPDHSLGAAAFRQDEPEYIGHKQLAGALAVRQSVYLSRMNQILGNMAKGTEMVLPTQAVDVGEVLKLDLGGRSIHLRGYPTAHTNNDLSVYDDKTGTLWLSDLLFVERIPVMDGSLRGWLKVIDDFGSRYCVQIAADTASPLNSDASKRCKNVNRIVPGHGPVVTQWKQALDDQRRYLELIATGIRKIIKQGGTITQAVASVGLEERDNWLLFDEFHGRNITAVFAELEWE